MRCFHYSFSFARNGIDFVVEQLRWYVHIDVISFLLFFVCHKHSRIVTSPAKKETLATQNNYTISADILQNGNLKPQRDIITRGIYRNRGRSIKKGKKITMHLHCRSDVRRLRKISHRDRVRGRTVWKRAISFSQHSPPLLSCLTEGAFRLPFRISPTVYIQGSALSRVWKRILQNIFLQRKFPFAVNAKASA